MSINPYNRSLFFPKVKDKNQTCGFLPRSKPDNKPETFGYHSGIKVELGVA